MSFRGRTALRIGLFFAGLVVLLVTAKLVWWLRPADPDRLFQQTRADLQTGRTARARQNLRRLARLRDPTPFDHLLRAQVADADGRLDEAVAELSAIPDSHSLAPVARTLTGAIESRRNRLRPAEAAFLAAIELEPNSPIPRRQLVYIYNLQHRQFELDEQLHVLSDLGELDFKYLAHWGRTRNVEWKPDRDCEQLAAAVAADPGDRRSRLTLAEGYQQLGLLDRAVAALAPLPDSDPDAIARRAEIELVRGDVAAVERLLANAPADNPRLARIRGMLALKQGGPAAAVRHLRFAYDADPTDRSVQYALGSALRLTGDAAGAKPLLEAARHHDALTRLVTKASSNGAENDPDLPALMGKACEAAGRLYEAKAWYKLAIDRKPLDSDSQKALYRISHAIEDRSLAAHARSTPSSPRGPTR